MGVFCVAGKALERVRRKYRAWLREGEEISYPNHFFVQLGVCAALFLVLAGLRNVQAEPVQAALAGLRSVATAEVELSPGIGKLEFVGNFVPESVLVYWNAGSEVLEAPFADAVLLAEKDGWAVFEGNGSLLAGGEGKVEAVEKCEGGYRLVVRHDNGLVCTMEPLLGVRVAASERVHLGQSVGLAQEVGKARQVRVQVRRGDAALDAEEWLR